MKVIKFEDGVLFEDIRLHEAEERAGKGDVIADAKTTFENALETQIRPAAQSVIKVLKGLTPHSIELEFGVKLTGEFGAIFTKAGAEGHITVTMSWSKENEAK